MNRFLAVFLVGFSTLAVAGSDTRDSLPSTKPKPKILQDKTWTWEGSQHNYARYTDRVFEVGIGNERNGVGCADAGVEIENVGKVKISVDASASFIRHDDNSFAGFMVDYHTAEGYTKRVALSNGMHSDKRWTKTPVWGKQTTPDKFIKLGKKKEYDLDLNEWAPGGWDGKVWFTVSLQNTGRNTRLKGTLLFLDSPRIAKGRNEKRGPKEKPAATHGRKRDSREERARFTPLDVSGAVTVASTRIFNKESLSFPKWGKQTHHGVPFMVIDPDSGKTKNAICLYSPLGAVSARMPRSVRLACGLPAGAIHVLGAAGWGVPWFKARNTLSMVMRVEYADGGTEDHQVINGVHLTDWAKGPDVPGSKGIGVEQVRYFSIVPKRQHAVVRAIELRKGTDRTSPLVMAVTVEAPATQIAQKPKEEPVKKEEKQLSKSDKAFQDLGNLPERPDSQGEVVISPNGKLLASGGMGNEIFQFGRELFGRKLDRKELHRIYVTDLLTGKTLYTLEGHTEEIKGLAFSPDSSSLFSGSGDGSVREWDMKTGREKRVIVKSVTMSGVGLALNKKEDVTIARILPGKAAALDGRLKVGDRLLAVSDRAGKMVNVVDMPLEKITAMVSGEDGTTVKLEIIPAGEQRSRRVELKRMPVLALNRVLAMRLSPDGKALAVACTQRAEKRMVPLVRILISSTGKELMSFQTGTEELWGLAFSPDSKLLVTAGHKVAKVWDGASGKELAVLRGHEGIVCSAAFSPDGRTLATVGWDRSVKLWKVASWEEKPAVAGQETGRSPFLTPVTFSPDGRFLVVGGIGNRFHIWDIETGKKLPAMKNFSVGKEGGISSLAFSADGSVLAAGATKGIRCVELWGVKRPDSVAARIRIDRAAVMQESYASVVKAAADKADAEWAAAKAVKKVDPLVSAVTAISSERHREHGFKEYKFGSSKEAIEKKFGRLVFAAEDNGWGLKPYGKGTTLYFVEDKLVGLKQSYGGDNKGYMRAVVEMFGTTPKENCTLYSLRAVDISPRTLSRPPAKTNRTVNRLDILFSFPKTVAYVCVSEYQWEVLSSTLGSKRIRPVGTGSSQKVTVFVYDRQFFVKMLNYHVTTQRGVMKWFKAACDAEDMAKLPKYPGQDTVAATVKNEQGVLFGMRNTGNQSRLVFTAMWPKSGPPTYNLFHPPVPELAELTVGNARVLNPNRRVGLEIDELETVPVPLTTPSALLSELHSRLVQEYFPPAGQTISFFKSRAGQFEPRLKAWLFKSHSWDAENGCTVTIFNTHTQVVKKPKKKL